MKTFAVHLHLYYLEQLPKILKRLKSLVGQNYDLFVTMVERNEEAEKSIKSFNANADITIVPNRGYDVGPFIEFLHKIDLDDYEYILKVHTKSLKSNTFTILNGHGMTNGFWNDILWNALLVSKRQVQKCLAKFSDEKIGMVGSGICLTEEKHTYENMLPQINEALIKLGLNAIEKTKFIAGTMFLCRAALMKPLLAYSINDFDQTDGRIKVYTLGHTMERVLAELVLQQGYEIIGISYPTPVRLFFHYWRVRIVRFLFSKKRTKHRLLIKIFKIPVWSRKEPT